MSKTPKRAMSIPGWSNENFNETFDPEVTIVEAPEVNFDNFWPK